MKFLPTVEEIAEMSPICSIIVAKAIGTMVITEVISREESRLPSVKSENTVRPYSIGRPNQAASATGAKSMKPAIAATR